jgi:hypothetical protein
MEKLLKNFSVIHPKKDELGKIDQLVSEKLQYPADSAYKDDFPRMLSEDNLEHLYGIKDSTTDEWISHVGVLPLNFTDSNNKVIKLLILGAVATETDHQGKGHASSLIERILSDFENKVDQVLLWGEIPEFYAKFGFKESDQDQLIILPSDFKAENPTADIQIVSRNELESDFYKTIYNEQAFKVERSDTDWEKILSTEGTLILGAKSKEGRPLAYMATDKGQDFPGIIHEWIGDPTALQILLEEMIKVAESTSLLSPGLEFFKNNVNTQKLKMSDFVGSILEQGGQAEAIPGALVKTFTNNDTSSALNELWIWGFDSH